MTAELCPIPVLTRECADDDSFEDVLRPCSSPLVIWWEDGGYANADLRGKAFTPSWHVRCLEHEHVLLTVYDDTNGPTVPLPEDPAELLPCVGEACEALAAALPRMREQQATEARRSAVEWCSFVIDYDDSIGGEGEITCGAPLTIDGDRARCTAGHGWVRCQCGPPTCRRLKVGRSAPASREPTDGLRGEGSA